MKILRSARMKSLLRRGKLKTRGKQPPSDGALRGLIHETLPNGWHYQVDWIHDKRFRPEPWIEVFAFHPRHNGAATHSLRSDN